MKVLLFLFVIMCSIQSIAQVNKVSLQASGLTCSMCSNSIYKALKTLSSVDKINANIKTSTFEITFKPGSNVDFNQVKNKVEDAGYAVAKFVALVNFKNVQVKSNEPVKIGSIKFQFINAKEQALNGEKQIRILNKGFVTAKEYKKVAAQSVPSDVYLASI